MFASMKIELGLSFIFVLILLSKVYAVPASSEEDKSIYDEIEDINKNTKEKFFEGDIVPNLFEQEVVAGKFDGNVKRDAKRSRIYLWRTRIVPYVIAAEYEKTEKDAIKNALKIFEEKTCLTFKKRSNETNWIQFKKDSGCSSSVGRNFWKIGPQTISLADGCLAQATILHEVMHALGFWHEQSRPDRDKFVEIMWENIEPSEMHNFEKYSHLQADVLGVDYDYDTIMHYSKHAFSKNREPTIKAIGQQNRQLGSSTTLSASDIIQINAIYDCASKGVSIWSTWSAYSPCDEFCSKRRQRFCSHEDLSNCPSANSHGIEEQWLQCTNAECYAPVDGHWSRWSSWGSCSPECGAGKKNRTRRCENPAPKHGGEACPGDSISTADCLIKKCGLGDLDCEFDGQGWCHWQNDPSNLNQFKWLRNNGRTPSGKTGPSGDHTSGDGYYLYTEASAPAKPGNKARIISKQIDATDGMCISFWYHMYGMTMGTLKMFVKSNTGIEQEIWNQSGDQGNQWLSANKTIISSTPFQVIFEAENGMFLSDMGLDDIMFKNRRCEKYAIEETCGIAMKSIGCFAESSNDRVLPELLDSHRDHLIGHDGFMIDWNNYPKSITDLLCHCAQRAKDSGYKYFGLQYYAECWSGPGEIDYSKHGSSNECVDDKYQECSTVKDQPCCGKGLANYMYKLL